MAWFNWMAFYFDGALGKFKNLAWNSFEIVVLAVDLGTQFSHRSVRFANTSMLVSFAGFCQLLLCSTVGAMLIENQFGSHDSLTLSCIHLICFWRLKFSCAKCNCFHFIRGAFFLKTMLCSKAIDDKLLLTGVRKWCQQSATFRGIYWWIIIQ